MKIKNQKVCILKNKKEKKLLWDILKDECNKINEKNCNMKI